MYIEEKNLPIALVAKENPSIPDDSLRWTSDLISILDAYPSIPILEGCKILQERYLKEHLSSPFSSPQRMNIDFCRMVNAGYIKYKTYPRLITALKTDPGIRKINKTDMNIILREYKYWIEKENIEIKVLINRISRTLRHKYKQDMILEHILRHI